MSALAGKTVLDVDTNQSNRYCIRLNTPTGKEAYYFSTPIYNESSGKLVRRLFTETNGCYRFTGSRAVIRVYATHIDLSDREREARIRFVKPQSFRLKEGKLISDHLSIEPTMNGVCVSGVLDYLKMETTFRFEYQNTRISHNCLCFMESKFKPILVLSALYSEGPGDVQPLSIRYVEQARRQGSVFVQAENAACRRGAMEIDFYESKLLQDTTVSSVRSNENNAFGPVAFLGKSRFFGTQWLYCRLNPEIIRDLSRKVISQVKLFFPRIESSSVLLKAYSLPNRFCSFGSNWNNKIPVSDACDKVSIKNDYVCVDLTQKYVQRGQLNESFGFVLVPKTDGINGYHPIFTGDCYLSPPILTINYK